ncbi:hypothetical protein JYU34_005076 [Plutella xylostella]|uniref:Reverse transcriptase domain-containing protein n=1 Tax=Plutella xylostella TaxID=51655 RepID=A0ABQ7QVS6_PLUXY|nr:hypothetical protein JYU34_005076 [Plutella xylostella]
MTDMINNVFESIDCFQVSKAFRCNPEECSSLINGTKNKLTILHQNIRSIGCNLSGFLTLAARIKIEPDLIILTESWLQSVRFPSIIDNYTYSATKINKIQNDGVVVYVKNHINARTYEPDLTDANCLVTIIDEESAVVSIYRSPSYKQLDKFIESLDSLLNTLEIYKNVIVTGDININIRQEAMNSHSSYYLDTLASHGLLSAHSYPTRESACLDHVIIRTKLEATTLVINTSLTDHSACMLSLNDIKLKNKKVSFKKVNLEAVSDDLSRVNFDEVYNESECNAATDRFEKIVTNIIENHSSTILLSRRKSSIKPWITPGLLRCMKNRDRLHIKARKQPDNEIIRNTYTRYRNFCNNLLKKIKQNYEKQILEKSLGNPKKTWEAINNITHFKQAKSDPYDINRVVGSKLDQLNCVNEYFANIGKTLASNIHSEHLPPDESHCKAESFVILDTDVDEIIHLIQSLKTDCAPGIDGISSKIIKLNVAILCKPICHIFNLCLRNGIFPASFKSSLILPLYKSGDKSSFSNYRPISILPCLSKILEKLINNRLTNYLENNNIISKNQFGFRKGKSTSDAVDELISYVVKGCDSKKKCIGIFLDIAKAFDTVSIPILLKKLELIGIRGLQHQLFTDYLSNRQQRIKIGSFVSDPLPMVFGVPQGSILGPTLFLIYINGLCSLKLRNCKIVTFADDTALLFQGESWDQTHEFAQSGFDAVSNWLRGNSLSLNSDKTKYICFSISSIDRPINALMSHSSLCLSNGIPNNCSCIDLQCVSSIKYLGIIIDNRLTFKEHIDLLSRRIRKLIAIFKNLRYVAEGKLLKTIYFALCQSLLQYGIGSWGAQPKLPC